MYFISYLLHFISTCRLKRYRKISHSNDLVRVVPNSCITYFHLTTRTRISTFYIHNVEKAYGKTCPIRFVKSTVLRISNYFLVRKTVLYFKYMDFSATYQPSSTYHFKRNAKKNSTHSEAAKTEWYRLYLSFTQTKMTMYAPPLVQRFKDLVHPNRSHRLSYLLRKVADMTGKIQQEKTDKHQKNEQTVHVTRHFSRQKSNGSTVDLPR